MIRKRMIALSLMGWVLDIGDTFSFSIVKGSSRTRSKNDGGRKSLASIVMKSSDDDNSNSESLTLTSDVVQTVAVTGATGKTGKLVVDELLNRNVKVIGLIRNETKAAELFGDYSVDMLELHECNLADPDAISSRLVGCDAVVWCATGFSSDAVRDNNPTEPLTPEQSIDVMGVPAAAKAMLLKHGSQEETAFPNIVMLSR